MQLKLKLAAALIMAGATSLPIWSQPEPSHVRLGAEKPVHDFTRIQIRNFQDESLGRIRDLGIDLVNGRIVEVLVQVDSSLNLGDKVIAVPPLALVPDVLNEVYRLDVSVEDFKTAAAINLSKWEDFGRSDRVAAAYHLFGQETYFLEEGATASKTADRPKVPLGHVERSSKILDLPVGNYQNEKFGKVWSLTLDITRGRILSVIVLAPGNFKTKTVIPATALAFNGKRDGLLLDSTKIEYRDEPRYVITDAAFGQDAYSQEEAYKGPHTFVALEQGTSYRDIDRTIQINRDIRTAKIDRRRVQVGTMNGRVTLRGTVNSEEDRRRVGELAIAASRLELVDNQITVAAARAR
jgi:sporulation protein YlmC with PRC-barrel domain